MRRILKVLLRFVLAGAFLLCASAIWAAFDTGYPGEAQVWRQPNLSRRTAPSVDLSHGPLQVARGGRFLVHADGTPFFFLGDTAWTLFHKLSRAETEHYLDNRRQKGFTVILASVMPDAVALADKNRSGQPVLHGRDPSRPNEAFFAHVDWVLDAARARGLYVALLPTWGDKVNKLIGIGPEIFNIDNARAYGAWLGARYRDRDNLLWVIGGDRSAAHSAPIWNAMAEGVRSYAPHHLMTFHPWVYTPLLYYPQWGGGTSATWFHRAPWLDFNSLQSGHWAFNRESYEAVAKDYALTPAKPVLDAEPNYEDHPFQATRYQWFRAADVRKAAYWDVFAGAFGHVYGHHAVWQFATPGHAVGFPQPPDRDWLDALDRPGAYQMGHLRALMESRPFLSRIPDQQLLESPGWGRWHAQATRDAAGSYAFVYMPAPDTHFTVRTRALSGATLVAWWFDPRDGTATRIGAFPKTPTIGFTTPARGPDWVLVLDDQSRRYGPPGQR